MIGEFLEKYSYEYLLQSALDLVPDELDKREGSIIYDALAPACYELANFYLELRRLLSNTYAQTAAGEYLDLRVAEQGVTRFESSFAEKKGVFTSEADEPMEVPLGARFSTITSDTTTPLVYVVAKPVLEGQVGEYVMRAEKAGTIGNNYTGRLLPITHVQNLKSATMTELLVPGRDPETDDELRERYIEGLNTKPFGGNVAQYDQMVRDVTGVGEVQVYPIWQGAGTVLLSVIDAEYMPISTAFKNQLQDLIDPSTAPGTGLGIAPIGHVVTVNTPSTLSVDINIAISLEPGYSMSQVEPQITAALQEYFKELRRGWGVPNEINQYAVSVYVAKINALIINIPGISNVTNTKVNNSSEDLNIPQQPTDNKIPVLGTVSVNESN